MKKILVLFLAIVVVACAGIGFGADSISNTNDPGSIFNIGQDYGSSNDTSQNAESSNPIDQNRSGTVDTGQRETNANEINQDENDGNNHDGNWYDGFWNNNNYNNGFWGDKDNSHKDDGNNKVEVNNEINNIVIVSATGGNAEATGGDTEVTNGNTEPNLETKFASGNKISGITSEIQEFNYKNVQVTNNQIPMQKTGLPIVPALLSTLMIGSSLLYKKLRKN